MIKRTLCFTNPAYLSTQNEQMKIILPQEDNLIKTVPIEDIGVIVLENQQITITNALLEKLVQNNVAIINCNQQHLPIGLLMPLNGHSEQSERFKFQVDASLPLKKNLWQQTVQAKITNQAKLLEIKGIDISNMVHWAKSVTSGDTQNHEARAAAYFWKNIFDLPNFNRHREGKAPNALLNYGYAILRAITARALVSSGMMPTFGIHHRNKYNAYCLADDIMEPYRPYVDALVLGIVENNFEYEQLNKEIKSILLTIPVIDVIIDGKKSPLMIAMSRTTNSLYECFEGSSRKLIYPEYE
jgi:CRISPR-associated protein Cas1